MMQRRDLYRRIYDELAADKEMVFLAGPRQVGKTTFAKMVADSFTNRLYCNWDIPTQRVRLLEDPDFFTGMDRRDESKPLVVFDELHKYPDWKNYLKGVYDRFHEGYQFLVTGSGRLAIYRKGGDSLAGRYLMFRMWPFTVAELGGMRRSFDDFVADPLRMEMDGYESNLEIWRGLSSLSGFPEPYLNGKKASYTRWSRTYTSQIVREDIRDLTGIKNLSVLETLYHLLPSRVASPLSIPSLARDLKVAYNSISSWLEVLERFFLVFSTTTWTKKVSRAIQKERKFYLLDLPLIEDSGARFENMVALELWRAVTNFNDLGLGRFSLHFVKDKSQQEVDFLLAERNKPFLLVEAKYSEQQPSAALRKFQHQLQVPAVQLVEARQGFRILQGEQPVLVAPACQWLAMLP